ncbi:HdaA/DnaA family protein [Acidisphaera sp. L21]|uniref:HdaA/DnaA family protein n=1 Tax=Acidisphaera sp. L21 TaxID=1641851 RepID=UPI00131E9F55|nr:chromosomal replication initiator DnaA [Acidisphaera sp. L21]
MSAIRQLALPFIHEAPFDPADFLVGPCNEEALAWLDTPWPANRLALWGEPGCGKTHLLHVWTARGDCMLLPGQMLRGLVELPTQGGLAVDDADLAPERPLLHLLNAAAEAGLPVLLAARTAPARWPTRLPDLASRLRAITSVELGVPDEAMSRTLFTSLLAARQLVVPEPVQDWLLLRLPREPAALREAAARLDHAALAAGRRITQAIAAQVLVDPITIDLA